MASTEIPAADSTTGGQPRGGPPMVLLAAGRSTRFGTLKQVAPVGPSGASILAYTILDALLVGFGEVVLVVRDEVREAIDRHLAEQLGSGLPIRYVDQSQPLGTGHAVLMAARTLECGFGVANGDDFYGRDAMAALCTALQQLDGGGGVVASPARAALIGYRMADTLSPHGGVSRGHVEVGENERVTGITEVHGVRWGERDVTGLVGTVDDESVTLPSDAWASMNLWGLGAGCTPLLESEFKHWQDQPEDARGEFAISTVLDQLRQAASVEIRLAGGGEEWFGLTFGPDADGARRRLEAKHSDGTYPVSLKEKAARING